MVALVVARRLPYERLSSPPLVLTLVGVSVSTLVLVLFMPAAGGARRWFQLGFANVQPSEFAKLVMVVFAAWVISRKPEQVNEPWTVPIPCLGVMGTLAFLVAIEPDLGSAVMLALVTFVMLFVAGLRWSYFASMGGVALLGMVAAVIAKPYRLQRIKTFLDPAADTQGTGYQLAQSLIAVGSGGVTGVGVGQGHQKAFFLPAAHTDFIFSVTAEEFGLFGSLLLLAGFLVLFWRGLRAARGAPDVFGFYLALGFTSLLVLQGLVHMGVCLGLLPTKGLPLPFVSYGGSSLVASMVALGLLLSVSRRAL
jgi:cell division protein FtsW